MQALKQAPGIVPALDTTLGKAVVLEYQLSELKREITGLKVGSDAVEVYGFNNVMPILRDVAPELPIIYDGQKKASDIPDQIEKDIRRAKRLGFNAYIGNVLGSGSYRDKANPKIRGSLEAFVDTSKEVDIVPIVVLKMTQPGDDYFLKENAGELLAELWVEYGGRYVVAPANKPEYVRKYAEIFRRHNAKIEIISPGVGPQKTGDPIKDAVAAVEYGTDHVVAGRAILEAKNPRETASDLYNAISEAHSKRLSR